MYLCKDGKPITIYDFQSFSRIYRLMKLDYPAAWYYGLFSTLLPYSKESTDWTASFETLSHEVQPLVDWF